MQSRVRIGVGWSLRFDFVDGRSNDDFMIWNEEQCEASVPNAGSFLHQLKDQTRDFKGMSGSIAGHAAGS